jgi:predicted MFS family arabinose efflux permease
MRRVALSLYALRATDEFIPWFSLYALYMLSAGLTPAELASLFIIWSATAFILEIPSGAWADTFSRRRLIAAGALLRGLGFLLWLIWPTYWGFAIGFVLWGVRRALKSGAVEALVYDELHALGRSGDYLRVTGRGQTVAIIAMMLAIALGTPLFSFGGYLLIGWLSIAVTLAGAVAALSFPETPRIRSAAVVPGPAGHYLHQLRTGLAEARQNAAVRHLLILAIGISGITAFDEFIPVLLAALGADTRWVPLLMLIPAAAMAIAALAAGRFTTITARTSGLLLACAGLLLAAGPLSGNPLLAMLLLAGTLAICQLARLVTEARLQSAITGSARATVLSVSGLGSQLFAVAIYLGYAIGSSALPAPALFALFAIPLLALAALTSHWLPSPSSHLAEPSRP